MKDDQAMPSPAPVASALDAEISSNVAISENKDPESLEDKSFSPNKPHPSLDFPPLYFLLAWFPGLREQILTLYKWRWSASYPLQKRVRGCLLRKYKIHLTYGEILIFIPLAVLAIVCVFQTFLAPSVSGTGKAARFAVVAALLFAQKNSYITMVLGVPFDRAVVFHKISGYVAVITGILHGVAYFLDEDFMPSGSDSSESIGNRGRGGRGGRPANNSFVDSDEEGGTGFQTRISELFEGSINFSGTMILICIISMFLTSLPIIRRKLFEFFYFIHLVLLVGIICGTAYHTGIMVPLIVFGTTGVDLIIRKLIMPYRYPSEATLRIISESVVEISFPKVKNFDYNPGQYVYIAIPELSRFEWHPFSLSSAPHQSKVSMHIRVAGNWTKALHELAFKKSTVPFMMEGPYGNFGVDVMSDKRYKVALLISGGIGLTPMQSMFSHLVHEQSTSERNLKKLKFVWIQRDPELMMQSTIADTSLSLHASMLSFMEDDEDSILGADSVCGPDDCASLASKILAMVPPSGETDQDLTEAYQGFDLVSESEDEEDDSVHNKGDSKSCTTSSDANTGEDSNQSPTAMDFVKLDKVLDIEIYLTKNDSNESRAHHIPGVKHGRPDLATMFVAMREEAIQLGEKRVAVCVCGPKRISALCRKACIQLSDKTVRFDYHEEAFG